MNLDFYDNRTVAYCDECTLPLSMCDCEPTMKRKIGLSKTRPTSEVVQGPPSRGRRRVALNREARAAAVAALPDADPETKTATEEKGCVDIPSVIHSSHTAITPELKGQKIMTLTLKGLDKRGRNAIYTGLAINIRVPLAAFPNKTALPTFEVEGAFAEKKVKLTAEQRKEARKNAPKPTAAEKLAKAEARLAKLREKVAADAAAPAGDAPQL